MGQGAGGREEDVSRRKWEGGLARNMGAAETEGQAAKGGEWERRRQTSAEDEANERAGRSGRRPGNIAVVCLHLGYLVNAWIFCPYNIPSVF